MGRMKKNDKRERLVAAADALILQLGFSTSTLADIAKAAAIPLGNVYYYFKTKESILDAVLDGRLRHLKTCTEEWENSLSPQQSLEAYIALHFSDADQTAHYGSALGSLCQELGKFGGASGMHAAKLMHEHLKWLEQQFKSLLNSNTLATHAAQYLMASLQGFSLLTLTFKDPAILKKSPAALLQLVLQQFSAESKSIAIN